MGLFGGRKKDEDRGGTGASGGDTPAQPRSPLQATQDISRSDIERSEVTSAGGASTTSRTKSTGSNAGAGTAMRAGSAKTSGTGTGGTTRTKVETKGGAVATIGKSIIFKGELTGSEDLEIEGSVEGDIKLPDHQLTIGANGKVRAALVAKCIQVIGHVVGDVTATERVEVQATGIIEGDIRSPRLLVQEGAVVNGAIDMGSQQQGSAGAKSSTGGGEPAQTERKAG
jgi:cytoskeletal protein CcmA (bactofilin family)